MIYYCIYIPFILLSLLDFTNLSLNSKRTLIHFFVFVLTSFWGIRWDCGTDWSHFLEVFQASRMDNIFTFDQGVGEPMEPGFIFLNALVKLLGGNYTCFLLIFNFLVLICFARFSLKYTKYPLLSFVYTIISLGIIFPNRQALAMGITSFSICYLLKRSFVKYCIPILLASTIHVSAIIMIPLYPLFSLKTKPWMIFIIYLISLEIGTILPLIFDSIINLGVFGSLISVRLISYSQTVSSIGDDFSSRGLTSFILSFSYLSFFVLKKMYCSPIKLWHYSFNGFLIMELIRNIFMETMRDFMRLELYFRPYASILLSNAFGNFSKTKYKYISGIIFASLMLYFFIKTLTGTFAETYFPYKTIFE